MDTFIKKDMDGRFTFKTLFNKVRDNDLKMKQLFAPQEYNEILDLIRYGDRLSSPILNSSGTDISRSFREMLSDIPLQLTNDQLVESMKKMARGAKPPVRASTSGQGIGVLSKEALQSLRPTNRQAIAKGLQVLSPQAESENNPISRALKSRR